MSAKIVDPAVLAAKSHIPRLPSPQDLSPELIESFKQQLAQRGLPTTLFKFDCEGQTLVFRPLLKADWNQINAFIQSNQGNVRSEDVDRKICEVALVWPQEILNPLHWDFQRAGLQPSLSKFVTARSGFFDPEVDQSAFIKTEPLSQLPTAQRPEPQVLEELKAKYHQWALKGVLIEGEYYVIRPLSRSEWKGIAASNEQDSLDLATAERGTVWSSRFPETPDFNNRLAGTVVTLSGFILQISGFQGQPTVEEL